ncbi:MAG: signal peptidase II [Chloroflexota bacterium]|nr:signal peptidase II [Chloroflexota bacterium]
MLNLRERSAGWNLAIPVLAVAALVVAIDQLAKSWVVATIGRGQATHETVLLPGWLVFQYTENVASAFGLLRGAWLPVALAIVIIAAAVITVLRLGRASQEERGPNDVRLLFSLGLIIGGGAGNLLDRFTRGYVVDFILIPNAQVTLNETTYRWPNFNIADSAITVGVLLLLIIMLLAPERKPSSPEAM